MKGSVRLFKKHRSENSRQFWRTRYPWKPAKQENQIVHLKWKESRDYWEPLLYRKLWRFYCLLKMPSRDLRKLLQTEITALFFNHAISRWVVQISKVYAIIYSWYDHPTSPFTISEFQNPSISWSWGSKIVKRSVGQRQWKRVYIVPVCDGRKYQKTSLVFRVWGFKLSRSGIS